MKTALVSLNVSYIHKNLALRWLYVAKPENMDAKIIEGTTRNPQACLKEILAYQPDIVGLSCYIFNIEATKILITLLKLALPSVRVILGGPEATYNPHPLWDLPIDGIVFGEGEFAFWEAISDPNTLGYQISKDQNTPILKTDLKKLETLESPYFLACDRQDMDKRYLYAETSRGCPYGCTYCMASLDRKVRLFSMDYLQTFFDRLKTTGVRQVKFLDRTFNVRPNRAKTLAEWCLAMPESMHFHVELVGDQLNENLIELFLNQGLARFRMEIGVQSFNPKTLEAVGRITDLKRLSEVISRLAKAGAHQHTDLIAGLPYEDLASFKQSLDTLARLKPFEIQVGILKLLHGSRLYDLRDAFGFTYEPIAPYQVTNSPWMSRDDIRCVEHAAKAMEKCYNSGRLKPEFDALFDHTNLSPFTLLEAVGKEVTGLSHPYTDFDFHQAIYRGLNTILSKDQARDLVNTAYYRHAKIKPPRLFEKETIENLDVIIRNLSAYEPDLRRLTGIYLKTTEPCGIDAWFYRHHDHIRIHLDTEGNILNHETYPSHP